MKKILAAFLCFVLASCATVDGIDPSELSRPEKITSFTLNNDVIGEMTATNSFGSTTKISRGLHKGKYISVFSDQKGTYYQGEPGCVHNPNYKNIDGGIWFPKPGSGEAPRLWIFLKPAEDTQNRFGVLVTALANIPAGNIRKEWFLTVEPFLLNEIHITSE